MSADAAGAREDRPPPCAWSCAWIGAVIGLVLACLALLSEDTAPAVLPADAPADAFSARRARAHFDALLPEDLPHPTGTAEHESFRRRLVGELERLGLTPRLEPVFERGPHGNSAAGTNVRVQVGSVPRTVLVASYDTTGASPGASGAACCAVLLELARMLGPGSDPGVCLLFADAGEVGLAGAQGYAREHAAEVARVLHLDGSGTRGRVVAFEAFAGSARDGAGEGPLDLPRSFGLGPRMRSDASWLYKQFPRETDLLPFERQGVAGVSLGWRAGSALRHTPLDDRAGVRDEELQEMGEAALAVLRSAPVRAEGAQAFLPLPALGVLVLERNHALLACAPLALLAAVLLRRVFRRPAPTRALLRAAAAAVTCGVVLVAFAWIHGRAQSALYGGPPVAFELSALSAWSPLLAGMTAAALVGALFTRRAADLDAVAGLATAGTTLVSAALALVRPELLPVPLVCGYAFGVGGLLAVPLRGAPGSFLQVSICALACLPVAATFVLGVGFERPLPCFLALWPIALAALPAVAGLAALPRVVLCLACAGVAALPGEPAPARLNLRYVHDGERGRARYELSTYGAPLAADLREAGFARSQEPPFSWLSLDPSLYVRAETPWSEPLPALEVRAREPVEGGRVLEVHVLSARGAGRLHLHHAPGAVLRAVRCSTGAEGPALELPPAPPSKTSHIFCGIPPEDGLVARVFFPAEMPAELWVLDQDWTLPPGFEELRALRPAGHLPVVDGDVSITGLRFDLDAD